MPDVAWAMPEENVEPVPVAVADWSSRVAPANSSPPNRYAVAEGNVAVMRSLTARARVATPLSTTRRLPEPSATLADWV